MPSGYSSTAQLPEDVVSCVIDDLRLAELIVASHVCQLWRRAAHNHHTFWGRAAIRNEFDAPAVDLFLARLAQAQIGHRPISVAIWPFRGLSHSHTNLSTMRSRVIPALSVTLSHITELQIEVPAELAGCMFDALSQPAPGLRSFRITNWKDWRTPTVIPRDIFATCAPQLKALTVADGIHLPDEAIPAFQAVERVKFLQGSYNVFLLTGVDTLLDRFPRLRDLAAFHQRMPEQAVISLTPQHCGQIARMRSLSLDVRTLMNLQSVQNAGHSIRSIRLLVVNFEEFLRDNPPPVDPQAIALLMPEQSEEMYCWLHTRGTHFAFVANSGPGTLVMRKTNAAPTYIVGARLWMTLSTHSTVVALSIDVAHWDLLRCDTVALPALEVLHIGVLTRLPRQTRGSPPVSSPCLQEVIFTSRRDYYDRGRYCFAIVTCRGIDEFLHTSLFGCVWASVDIALIDVCLYGPNTVPGTHISGVRMASDEECSARGARTAILIEHAHDNERLE